MHLRAVAVGGGDDRVRGLVHGDRLQLVGAEHVRVVARAADHALDRLVEVVHADRGVALAGAEQRGLVDDVLELGAREAGAAAGDLGRVDVRRARAAFEVERQDLRAALGVGRVDR